MGIEEVVCVKITPAAIQFPQVLSYLMITYQIIISKSAFI